MAEQDFSEIAKLSERYSKDPKSRIFVQLADAYRKSNMVDEALEVLKQGLQHHPQYPLAHLIQGRCFFDKRLYTQAKESFDKVIKFDPQNIVALRMIAQVCETLKDEAGQIAAYKGLLAVDPSDATAQEKLNVLEALQKKQSFFTITMAQEYERQGNLAEALKIYENLGFSDPSDLGIQERIRDLKQKLNPAGKVEVPAETKPEEKAEGLEQFESYLRPHEIDFNAVPPASTTGKAVLSELPETKPVEPAPKNIEKMLEAQPPAAAVPSETPKSAMGNSDLVSSVTDFMINQPSAAVPQIEPGELKKEEPAVRAPEKPAVPPVAEIPEEPAAEVAPLSEPLTADVSTGGAGEKPTAPIPVKEEAELLSISDLLIEEPKPPFEKHPETPAITAVEPEPAATPVVETVAPAAEDVVSITDLLEAPPSVAETPSQPAAEPPPAPPDPIATQPETVIGDQVKPPAAEPATPAAEPIPANAEESKPEAAEEPKKSKEEDFKSFQDWLSGLLK